MVSLPSGLREPRTGLRPSHVAVGALAAAVGYAAVHFGYANTLAYYLSLLAAAVSVGYLLWRANPAYTLTAAVVLATLSGHYKDMGLPGGYVAPDRFLVVGALGAIALRGPWMKARPTLVRHPAHVLMGLAVFYVVVSGGIDGQLLHQKPLIKLVEAFGILPYLVFFLAPAAFQQERHRRILIAAMVGLGAYLSLTALLETLGANSLVWPHYITDPNVGIHFGRARGPFTEAVTNGIALYTCGLASVLAFTMWRKRLLRVLAVLVIVGCAAGLIFTLQRSVWIGSIIASLIAALAARELRRFVIPVAVFGAIAVGIAIVTIPGLNAKVHTRASDQRPIWDRENLARAAQRMILTRPMLGFGWDEFPTVSPNYFQLGNVPLSAAGLEVHNVFLGYTAELGLIGAGLWALALLTGVLSALMRRGPPELRPWRIMLLAYAILYVFVSNFVPPQLFPNLLLWLLAGVVWSGRLPQPDTATAR